jgi:ABC-2 type transport system permease protein
VTLDVHARKVVVDEAGLETQVMMNDWVEIGLYGPPLHWENALGSPLYVQRHRIRSGRQSITVALPDKPARGGIDPYHLLIDLEPRDNFARVTSKS